MKAKFKIGDKVRILNGRNIKNYTGGFTHGMRRLVGEEMTIRKIEEQSENRIGYRMEESALLYDERGLELVNQSIVIYRNNREVIALDKSTGKKAIAKCNPQDKFDFYVGASLALNRLTNPESEKPKYYNGFFQIVKMPTEDDIYFTMNKIYEVVDGKFIDNQKIKFPVFGERFKTFEELKKYIEGHTVPRYGAPDKYKIVEIKEVKRLAKPGEYIKIVNADNSIYNEYKNDDILKVVKCEDTIFGIRTYYRDEVRKYVTEDEYVVLEGYTEAKEEEIKVGDSITVIDTDKTYSTYVDFFKHHKISPEIAARYEYLHNPSENAIYKVLFIGGHTRNDDIKLAMIRHELTGKVYLIGVEGIKKC